MVKVVLIKGDSMVENFHSFLAKDAAS